MKHNLRKEINLIRKKSFSEIRGVIWIIKIPFPIPGAMIIWLLPNLNLLFFTNKCKTLPRNALRGIIAHELSHFSIFQKKKWRNFWKFFFTATRGEGVKMEKKTDKFAIKKGYGKDLVATKRQAVKHLKGTRWEPYLSNYLTEKEVREYMNKNK